ncbi:MAG TPA: HAMP domain-containing sensor histidine kinase [Ilumatobacter sp.]
MRRRLVISTIAIVLVVLGALAVPVGLIVYNAAEQQLQSDLADQAAGIADSISQSALTGIEPDYEGAAAAVDEEDGIRIIDDDGEIKVNRNVASAGSTRMATRVAANGAQITVSTDASPLDEQFREQLSILLILAAGAILAAAGLAAVQAHQLARPLERLAARAGRIGVGDFSTRPVVRTHIPEIDDIGTALETSSQRVDTMLANERHFTADATHQLRTGITGIAMRFEILSMRPERDVVTEARAGLAQTDQLNATIDELLEAARDRSSQERVPFDLTALVNHHAMEWQPRFSSVRRHLSVITASPAPLVVGTMGLAGQVIDILIDNALRHGDGAVTLMIDGPSVVVIDQGKGMPMDRLRTVFDGPVDPAAKHGRGLALARRLAQVDGASLDVVGNQPLRIRFRLVRGDHERLGEPLASSAR